MALKKTNAAIALLLAFLLLIHVIYSVYSYLTLSYDPFLTSMLAMPTLAVACLHGAISVYIVFFRGDGTRLRMYPSLNRRTIVQLVSAGVALVLLIFHVQTFYLLLAYSLSGQWFLFAAAITVQFFFYAAVFIHVAASFSRAFITFGWIVSEKALRILDRAVYSACTVVFAVSLLVVVHADFVMFVGWW